MVETLLDKAPLWLAGDGPEASVVVASECSLLRNLADFPFPARCSEEERRSIEERMMDVLERVDLLANGQYCPLSTSLLAGNSSEERLLAERFLAERLLMERRLVAFYQIQAKGPRGRMRFEAPAGAYVAEDQSMSIMVNGADHMCMRVLASGLQLLEVWARLNLVDDTLAGALDFAFDDRYGYFTSDLGHVGTGLKASVILHLPGLAMVNKIDEVDQLARERHQILRGLKPTIAFQIEGVARGLSQLWPKAGKKRSKGGSDARSSPEAKAVSEALYSDWYGVLYGAVAEAEGDLYLLSNTCTLGISEEETLFHLRHLAGDIIAREEEARQTIQQEDRLRLEDRVARALGLARKARLLEFSEALALLSSIRLGVATGLVEDYSIQHVNELLIASQGFHIRMKTGQDCDELTLGTKRADLFRTRFSPD